MFGGRHNTKVNHDSDANGVPTKSEEEGWEVVKQAALDPQFMVSGAGITDVSTQTERVVVGVSGNWEGGSKNNLDSQVRKNDIDPSIAVVLDVIPPVRFQHEMLARIDFSQVAEQGTKSYYFVKRNLKMFVLLFALGVFCGNTASDQRSKQEIVRSSLSTATLPDGNMQDEYSILLVKQLKTKMEQLEETYRQVSHDLSMAVLDRNHWRTLAVSCDQELRDISSAHSRLEEEVKQSKWLAPVAFVSPLAPLHVNASAIAATHYAEDEDLLAPEQSPTRRIPYPQLALPFPDPKSTNLRPKPSMKTGRGKQFSGLVLAPSVAVTVV